MKKQTPIPKKTATKKPLTSAPRRLSVDAKKMGKMAASAGNEGAQEYVSGLIKNNSKTTVSKKK